jgi:hypothetical protein
MQSKSKEYSQRYYQQHKEVYRQRYRKWYAKHGREYYGQKRKEDPGRFQAAIDRNIAQHPERERARVTLKTAVYEGRIEKPSQCSMCHKEVERRVLHGHHPDWSKPLEVIWACAQCHKTLH